MSSTTYNKICPKCGAQMKVRQDVMTSSIPPMNIYDCPKCGNVEYDTILYPCELGELVTQSKNEVDLCDKTDYKAKYEEALERAKELIAKWTGKNKDFYTEDYAYIFPELRENEDERTRKEIIGFIQSQIEDGNSAGWDRWIAWLEKQKEPEIASASTIMIPSCWEEKREEQKPAEWSEEDEKRVSRIISFIIKYRRGDTDEIYQQEQDAHWLLDLRNRYAWKPSKGQSEKSKKDCNGCPHCVDRKDQYGWHFKGCIGGPYNGKFIAEIDECPLKQEQPSKGLEEAANRYAENNTKEEYHTDEGIIQTYGIANNAFISGANWQKEQMMRDAVDYRIVNNLAAYPIIYYDVHHLGLKYGDKVKLIILKDDEK